ncbi:MAG: hypothetical protein L0177_16805, partial [Chloroflexi bacterium]|nr:hypothetical protein [Chloroflexota bacterium]
MPQTAPAITLHAHNDDRPTISEIVGPYTWGLLHFAVESFPCPACAEDGKKLIRAIHDLVNWRLEKPMRYPANFRKIAEEFARVASSMNMHQECSLAAFNQGMRMLQEKAPVVRISGKCTGINDCSLKASVTERFEAVSDSIQQLPNAIADALDQLEAVSIPATQPRETFAIGPVSGTRYEFEWRVVSTDDVITSHNPFTFQPTPGYPLDILQTRRRDRVVNQQQVSQMAAALDPDRLITDFHALDRGSPIVGPDMLVESGNGRTMSIKRAAGENLPAYLDYVEALIARAHEFGHTREEVEV